VQVFAGPGPAHVKLAFNRLYPGIANGVGKACPVSDPSVLYYLPFYVVNLRFFGQKYFPAMEFAFPQWENRLTVSALMTPTDAR
jgi:hypothetical protein